jgi:hypothetical protein
MVLSAALMTSTKNKCCNNWWGHEIHLSLDEKNVLKFENYLENSSIIFTVSFFILKILIFILKN